jgi:hypothetical protein
LSLKLLLKRGALLAAANWQTVAIQFAAQTVFQALLAVPVVGAAILMAVLLGADLANLLDGGLQEIMGAIAAALTAEPVALGAFAASFAIALTGGSLFMFLVKGGTMHVLMLANDVAGDVERDAVTLESLRPAAAFTMERFQTGCSKLFRRYLALGVMLTFVYGLSVAGCFAFIVFGYRAVGGRDFVIGWAFLAAVSAVVLVLWITVVNLLYLLLQIAVAVEDVGIADACRAVARFVGAEFRDLGGVFLVVLALVVGATLASALAWSGVGLVAFIPLVGLAVFPMQILALVLRGLAFEYIGLTSVGAYLTLYRRRAAAPGPAPLQWAAARSRD